MASEIRVNSLTNRSGLSTVTIADTGVVVAGIVTASTFSGPLTGDVTGNVTGNTSGTATNLTGSPSITVTDITATGNLSIGGVLTYDDVTNVDSVGIVTARTGIDVTGGHIDLVDNSRIRVGTDDDLQIFHDGSQNAINSFTSNPLNIISNGDTTIKTNNNDSMAVFKKDNAVELYYDNSKKLETTTTGAKVTGALEVTQEYPSIRPTLDLNFAATKTLDRRITFTRDSLGTFTDDMGIVKYAPNNVPRFDHDPTTGESLGLLIEESRTNDVAHSDPGNDVWIISNAAVVKTANTTDTKAPDGSFTALKLASQATGSSTSQIYDTLNKSSGGVQSVWAKKGTHNVLGIFDFQGASGIRGWFDLNTGEHRCEGGSKVAAGVQSNGNDTNNTNMIEYPNGWYRCMYYESANMTYLYFRIVDFDSDTEASSSSNTIYLWGAQAEVNKTFATSFIPSLSGTMPATNSTRAQDTAKITGTNLTDFYNQPEGTIFADYKVIQSDPEIMYLSNNTSSKRIGLYEAGSNQTRFLIGNSGTQADTTDSTGTTVGDNIKAAGAYKLNDIVAAKNGVISSTDSSATIPDGIDRAYIGGYFNGTTEGVLGLRRLSYYPKRLPNAQLQGLTQQ